MLYVLIKRADTYMDRLDVLIDNSDISTQRLMLFAEQVIKVRDWYKSTVNNLHEEPPHSGSGSVSEYIIALQAHSDEIAFSSAYPEVYSEKYQALAGAVSRFISAYHSAVETLAKQQLSGKGDIEYLQSKHDKAETRHREQMRYLVIIIIAISIGQWLLNM